MTVPLNANLHGHCVVSLSQSICGKNGLKTWLSFLSSPMLALRGAGLEMIIYKTLKRIDCYQEQLTDISNKLLFMTFIGESAIKYMYVCMALQSNGSLRKCCISRQISKLIEIAEQSRMPAYSDGLFYF